MTPQRLRVTMFQPESISDSILSLLFYNCTAGSRPQLASLLLKSVLLYLQQSSFLSLVNSAKLITPKTSAVQVKNMNGHFNGFLTVGSQVKAFSVSFFFVKTKLRVNVPSSPTSCIPPFLTSRVSHYLIYN